MFITFEGIDGSGKTQMTEIMSNHLRNISKKVFVTHEPMYYKKLLMQKGCDGKEQLFLFLADRARHIREEIQPALNRGDIVICDRFIDSTIVYQRGVIEWEDLVYLQKLVCDGVEPDVTFLLDVSPHEALKRIKTRGIDASLPQLSQLYDLRNSYLNLWKENKTRIKLIDANHTLEEVKYDILMYCFSIMQIMDRKNRIICFELFREYQKVFLISYRNILEQNCEDDFLNWLEDRDGIISQGILVSYNSSEMECLKQKLEGVVMRYLNEDQIMELVIRMSEVERQTIRSYNGI